MTIAQAVVLGIVQGLGEFLPISSSAHLIIAPWLLRWPDPGLGFDVALHWGTLLAVLAYFRTDVWNLIKGFWHSLFPATRDIQNNIYQKLSWLLVIASLPGAIIGKMLESAAESSFRGRPLLIAGTLAAFGLVLWLADVAGKKLKDLNHITWKHALAIGLAQAAAIVPGVSRSGATIATGLFAGFKREDAARFSFLMSMPIIFGAGLVALKDGFGGVSHQALAAGFIASAIFGFLSIKYLLRYLSRHDYKIFAWYRLIAALVILSAFFIRK